MEKMYVLIRRDLNKKQQSVQAGHALAEYLLTYPTDWSNGTLIYLAVNNEAELASWAGKLEGVNIKWTGFREPDINNELTAIAAVTDT